MSEFGRTPTVNGSNGKDHWPEFGNGHRSRGKAGRNIGATDDGLLGLPIDFGTGVYSDNGEMLTGERCGTEIGGSAEALPGIGSQRLSP